MAASRVAAASLVWEIGLVGRWWRIRVRALPSEAVRRMAGRQHPATAGVASESPSMEQAEAWKEHRAIRVAEMRSRELRGPRAAPWMGAGVTGSASRICGPIAAAILAR